MGVDLLQYKLVSSANSHTCTRLAIAIIIIMSISVDHVKAQGLIKCRKRCSFNKHKTAHL